MVVDGKGSYRGCGFIGKIIALIFFLKKCIEFGENKVILMFTI